jgi:ribA/ribD-fused uncharacterized protein
MITRFIDEYRWLSNFVPVEVEFEGVKYSSVEHAYQAAKSEDPEWREFCATELRPGKIKRGSRRIEIREDWLQIRVDVMRQLLAQKFIQEPYKTLLLETGDTPLTEGNTWGDTFWGVDLETGEGDNVLGNLIMDIRRAVKTLAVEI